MTIGDDLQILLGLVPTRDRAGIQRGTMATEAASAAARSDGNAEGQALTRQGFMPPPPISLPPTMGQPEPDAANMPIAHGQPAQGTGFVIPGSTGGPSAAPPPAPRERVVAASPAAAPSPGVTRHSDIILQAIEDQKRQAKMQQLFSGLGLLANGFFNRDADSSNATQKALLAGGAGGGGRGGGTDIATLKTLLDMRGKEDEDIAKKATRQRLIDYAVKTEGWTPEDAAAKVDAGVIDEFMKPETLLKKEEVRRTQQVRDMLGPNASAYAKALKMDETAFRAMVHDKPGEAIALLTPEKMAAARKLQLEGGNLASAQAAQEAEIRAILADPEAAKDPAGTMARVRAIMNPAAAEKGLTTRAENIEKLGEGGRVRVGKHYAEVDYPEGLKIAKDLERASQFGDVWHKDITTGTVSDLRQAFARAGASLLGIQTPDLNSTTQVDSILKRSALARMREIGGNDSNRDLDHSARIAGATTMGAMELRSLAVLNEKADRQELEKNIARREAYIKLDPHSEAASFPPIEMPKPSKILMADIYEPEPKHQALNTQLRTAVAEYDRQYKANPTPENLQDYKKVETKFNREYGAGMAKEYLAEEAKKRSR